MGDKTLFPDQVDVLNEVRGEFKKGKNAVLLVAATGFGKSVCASEIIEGAINKGTVVWFLVHRRELIRGMSKTLYAANIPHSFIANGFHYDSSASVFICSVGTLRTRLGKVPDCDLLVVDECHHIAATTYTDIIEHVPNAKLIGLTATPWRSDGIGLGRWFQSMVLAPDLAWLIEHGRLSKYKIFAPPPPDLSGVKSVDGDYIKGALAKAMDKPKITGNAIEHYQELCHGKRAVVFCVSIDHSKHVAQQFRDAGIPAAHIDGTMDDERDATFDAFERGEILVLCNVDLVSEGVDVPAIEAVILLRPTKSLVHFLQSIGRALRISKGKFWAYVLDHAGNSLVHGLPDDPREWTLEDREKKAKSAPREVSIVQCPECWHVYKPQQTCPQCGHKMPIQARKVEEVDGKLEEVTREKNLQSKLKRLEERDCKSLQDWQELASQRGYKQGWAMIRWQSRKKGKPSYG